MNDQSGQFGAALGLTGLFAQQSQEAAHQRHLRLHGQYMPQFVNSEPEGKKPMTLGKIQKMRMPKEEVSILEAFYNEDESLNISSPEFGAWFFEKFKGDETLVAAANERLERVAKARAKR